MNTIRCEACGASHLLKDGDYFVCQYCGCKYRREDILINSEGQVNIEKSSVVINSGSSPENILTIARRAHDDRNADLARKYYNRLLDVDPSSWEAYFYTLYYDIMTCRIDKTAEKCINMMSAMETALQMMVDNITDPKERRENIGKIASDFMALEDSLNKKIFSKAADADDTKYLDYIKGYYSAIVCAGLYCSTMYNTFGSSEVPLYYDCWCKTVDMFSDIIKKTVSRYGRFRTIGLAKEVRQTAAEHIVKIKKYNPSYVKPKNL